jgi:hypothetical protein
MWRQNFKRTPGRGKIEGGGGRRRRRREYKIIIEGENKKKTNLPLADWFEEDPDWWLLVLGLRSALCF